MFPAGRPLLALLTMAGLFTAPVKAGTGSPAAAAEVTPPRGVHAEAAQRVEPIELYRNGPLVNCQGCGVDGVDESVLQSDSLGMEILGFGNQAGPGNRLADDFVVPEGHEWTCSSIQLYAYQTDSGLDSTLTAVTLRLWDGPPGEPGSQILGGDISTNQLLSTEWADLYRVTEAGSGVGSTRPVMVTEALLPGCENLPPGHYWVDWDSAGTLPSGPWVPPITLNGQVSTGDALQSTDRGVSYNPLLDSEPGTLTPQGLAFEVSGTTTGPVLSIEGSCPGNLVISLIGGTPNGSASFFTSLRQGPDSPAGSCSESLIGLTAPALAATVTLDPTGSFETTVATPASVCSLYVEAIDDGTCSVTNVVQLQ